VWIVDNGEIEFYDGNFDDYRNELIKEITAELDEE
jgi:ATP-binding cassette subfamily F protein 1